MRSCPSKEEDPRSHGGAVRGRQEAQEEEQHQPWTGEGGDVGKLSEDFSRLTCPGSASAPVCLTKASSYATSCTL